MFRKYPLLVLVGLWCMGSQGCQNSSTAYAVADSVIPQTSKTQKQQLRQVVKMSGRPHGFNSFPLVRLVAMDQLPNAFELKMPPSEPQGRQWSCVGFAVGYSMQSYYRKNKYKLSYFDSTGAKNRSTVCSPAHLYNHVRKGPTNCTSKTYSHKGLNFLRDSGIVTWTLMPYYGDDVTKSCTTRLSAELRPQALENKIVHWARMSVAKENIQLALYNHHPVVVGVNIYSCFVGSSFWKKTDSCPDSEKFYHYMIVYGWDSLRQAFKVQDSWDSTHVNGKGYVWVDYDFFDDTIVNEAYMAMPEPNDEYNHQLELIGTLNFGTVYIGNEATRPLTLVNHKNDTLIITGLAMPKEFSSSEASLSIPPKDSAVVMIRYKPKYTVWDDIDSLVVYGNYQFDQKKYSYTYRVISLKATSIDVDKNTYSLNKLRRLKWEEWLTINSRIKPFDAKMIKPPFKYPKQLENSLIWPLNTWNGQESIVGTEPNHRIKTISVDKGKTIHVAISSTIDTAILEEEDLFSLVIVYKQKSQPRFAGKIFNGMKALNTTFSFQAEGDLLWAFVVCPSQTRVVKGEYTISINGERHKIPLHDVVYLDQWATTRRFNYTTTSQNKVTVAVKDNDTEDASLLLLVGITKEDKQVKLKGKLFNPKEVNVMEQWSFNALPSVDYLYGFALNEADSLNVDYTIEINDSTFRLANDKKS